MHKKIPEDVEEEVLMKNLERNDPFEQRLKSLEKDVSRNGLKRAWNI